MKVPKSVKWGCVLPLGSLISLFIILSLIDELIPSKAIANLPDSAKNIKEYESGGNDFIRLILAEFPIEDYEPYAKDLGLSDRFDVSKHNDIESIINISISDAPAWWSPPSASGTTFFHHVKGDEYVRVLKYSNGIAYYLTLAW